MRRATRARARRRQPLGGGCGGGAWRRCNQRARPRRDRKRRAQWRAAVVRTPLPCIAKPQRAAEPSHPAAEPSRVAAEPSRRAAEARRREPPRRAAARRAAALPGRAAARIPLASTRTSSARAPTSTSTRPSRSRPCPSSPRPTAPTRARQHRRGRSQRDPLFREVPSWTSEFPAVAGDAGGKRTFSDFRH